MAQDSVDPPKIRRDEFLRDHPCSPVPDGYGLHDFAVDVTKIAREGETNPKRLKEDRDTLARHRMLFTSAVSMLDRFFVDQPDDVREFLRLKLWQATGSVSVIASYEAQNPVVRRKGHKLSERGANAILMASQRTDEILIAAAQPKWGAHPTRSSNWVAGEICETMSKQLEAEKLRPLGRSAIRARLKKLKLRIIG